MKHNEKTYETAQTYIDKIETETRGIELLESLLSEKHKKIEKTLAKLRAYKNAWNCTASKQV